MDIGFLMAPTAQSGDLAETARLIESLGYESLWIPEHPVIPVNMKTPFPFTPDNKLPDHYARWADPFIGLPWRRPLPRGSSWAREFVSCLSANH